MLDASASEAPKSKKKTPQNRPLQRFWPDSIAAGGGSHQQVTMPDGTLPLYADEWVLRLKVIH